MYREIGETCHGEDPKGRPQIACFEVGIGKCRTPEAVLDTAIVMETDAKNSVEPTRTALLLRAEVLLEHAVNMTKGQLVDTKVKR